MLTRNQQDVDGEGSGDACDNCPSMANHTQSDMDATASATPAILTPRSRSRDYDLPQFALTGEPIAVNYRLRTARARRSRR